MQRHGGGLPIEGFAALRRAKDIIGQAALAWIRHDASTMGAALARSRMSGFGQIVRARFLSLGLVFGVGFLLMVSLLVSTVLAALDAWIASFLGEWRTLLLVVDLTLSLSITTGLFAFVYKYIPQAKMEWGDVWVGAVVAAVLFNIGKVAIGYYLGRSSFASIYGAVGSLLVLLLWAYYSAQIFLFGAEFTKTFSFISGTRRGLKV